MKTNAIIRIVLFSITILVLLGILGIGLGIGALSANFGIHTEEIVTTEQGQLVFPGESSVSEEGYAFEAAAIRDLTIEWAAGSITIQPTDTDIIEVLEYGSGDPMVCRREGDKLVIKFDNVDIHFGITINYSKDLVINVPRGWVCDSLEIDAASADVDVTGLEIREVDFDGASGVCTFTDCTVDEMDVDTASGNVNFEGALNALECDAASADCTLVLYNTPKRIDMDCASGDLDITLPASSGFTVTMDGLSTDFNSDFNFTRSNGRYVCGDGSCRIEIDAMSGDLVIRKGE